MVMSGTTISYRLGIPEHVRHRRCAKPTNDDRGMPPHGSMWASADLPRAQAVEEYVRMGARMSHRHRPRLPDGRSRASEAGGDIAL